MHSALLFLTCAAAFHTALADDLDLLVDTAQPEIIREQAYHRLIAADPSNTGPKLLRLIGAHPVLPDYDPPPGLRPWQHPGIMSKDEYVAGVLNSVWTGQVEAFQKPEDKIRVMRALLEDHTIGEGMYKVIYELPEEWPPDLLKVMQKFAGSPTQDEGCRNLALAKLFSHGDVDAWVDTAIALSKKRESALVQCMWFANMAGEIDGAHISPQSRQKLVRYGFPLLIRLDTGRTEGPLDPLVDETRLAIALGRILQISPLESDSLPFAPDRRLPKYQNSKEGELLYCHQVVGNALSWWVRHHAEYEDAAAGQ